MDGNLRLSKSKSTLSRKSEKVVVAAVVIVEQLLVKEKNPHGHAQPAPWVGASCAESLEARVVDSSHSTSGPSGAVLPHT